MYFHPEQTWRLSSCRNVWSYLDSMDFAILDRPRCVELLKRLSQCLSSQGVLVLKENRPVYSLTRMLSNGHSGQGRSLRHQHAPRNTWRFWLNFLVWPLHTLKTGMNAVAGCWAAKKTHNSNRACKIRSLRMKHCSCCSSRSTWKTKALLNDFLV